MIVAAKNFGGVMLGPRVFLSIVAVAEDVDTLVEWCRVQASIHRLDADVVEVEARMVVDDAQGRPLCTLLEV